MRQTIAYINSYSLAVAGKSNVKSSVQRKIRERIVETYPLLEPHMDDLMHKAEKGQMEAISVRLYESLCLRHRHSRHTDLHDQTERIDRFPSML
jgi:hypothetical protein